MKKILVELQYLPPVSYYAKLLQYDEIVLEQHENFVKSSYRNRCYILAANGKLRLSIPLTNGRDHKDLYTNVKTDNKQRWKSIHWQSILSAYKHAPFFEHYAPYFEKHFTSSETDSLFQFNLKLFEITLRLLKAETKITFTESYMHKADETFLDARNLFQPEKNTTENFEAYIQVFSSKHGFHADLSIIDLLFNLGTEAKSYLRKIPNHQ